MTESDNRFCIISMKKVKMTALRASQIHNERLTDKHSNPDIDISKSSQNIIYHRTKGLTENVKKRIEEIQSRQKRKIRSDSPVAIEYVITASPEALKRFTLNEQKEYWQKCLKFVEARHGAKNALSAVLHVDETNPHLHVLVFAERDNKLDAKSFFKLTELTKMHDDFAEQVGKHFGLKRGFKYTELIAQGKKPKHHKSVRQYKAEKYRELEEKTKLAAAELEDTQSNVELAKLNLNRVSAMAEDEKADLKELEKQRIKAAAEVKNLKNTIETLQQEQKKQFESIGIAQKVYEFMRSQTSKEKFSDFVRNVEKWYEQRFKTPNQTKSKSTDLER